MEIFQNPVSDVSLDVNFPDVFLRHFINDIIIIIISF
jgi:hypothetical protein